MMTLTSKLTRIPNLATHTKYALSLAISIGMLGSFSAHAETQVDNNSSLQNTQPSVTINNSNDGIIALVNDTPILKSQLTSAVQQAQQNIRASGATPPPLAQLQNEVLNGLILRELQLDIIRRAGIRPSANAVNQRLQALAQSQGFNSLAELQQRLDAQQPGRYAQIRQQIIEEESLRALQQRQVMSRVHITDQDIDAYLASPEGKKLEQSEYRTIHIRIPYIDDYSRISDQQKAQALQVAQQVRTALQNTDDAQQAIEAVSNDPNINYPVPLQGGDMGYHPAAGLPTELASTIANLPIGSVTEPQMTPQGIDIIKLTDKRNSDELVIPQWHVRHILIKTDERQNDALAQQKINDIYNQLNQGSDFASLASTYSDDTGSAGRGGDLDWISAGDTVPAFEEVMQKTPVGEISAPFKSQFGWHILQVTDSRKKDVSEQYRRNLAREALFQRLAPQAQEDWLQELKANAYIKIIGQ
ncbi:peptidylprolyl isomerase [Psychrobacter sp. I-STPA6b]|uniref:peptidylprolyl isomerase n=1 Tax=Psychrobacter sp. I-STPA6b TaxID=2585718 RepID=UPI001D0C024B|nr:peptidylprolyl isomerase [Psychrobacter sp. I-STPA6b]